MSDDSPVFSYNRIYAALALAIIAATAIIEHAMGRVAICTCGYVKLWEGDNNSSGNSQHLTDWYTFSHLIHGFLFYFFAWLVGRRLPIGQRFVLAVLIEAAWEVLENSPIIIDRYRTSTISLGYAGDAILNSMSDIAAMMIGFYIAMKLPAWATIGLAVTTEIVLAILIRDNLTLNVIMLVWPIEAIKNWQAGA